jgi:hypothetical protein
MKIKTTHPIIDTYRADGRTETIEIQAGIVFDAPDAKAADWIEKDWAIAVEDEKPKKAVKK